MTEKNNKNILYCSFCGKSQHEVRKLIAGPTVFICDECVELCMDIIKEENKSSFVKHQEGVPSPKEICKVLDDYVIGQKFAKEILSVAVQPLPKIVPDHCCSWVAHFVKNHLVHYRSKIDLISPFLFDPKTEDHDGYAMHAFFEKP